MSAAEVAARPGVVVHGGAGAARIAPARLPRYRAGLAEAAEAGYRALAAGGSALDAVEVAVRSMEASGAFNAGQGSCLNLEREIECDAAIMDGDLRAGAVGALRGYRHPISVARKILEVTDHVLLVGTGAARLAAGFGLEPWSGEPTPERLAEWAEVEAEVRKLPKGPALARLAKLLRHGAEAEDGGALPPLAIGSGDTVGAVAIDAAGHVAAAVSTGGLWLKLPGRVGDSAIPGAGVYADDRAGAASATGIGEAIIRVCLSRYATESMNRENARRPGASRAQAGVEEAIRLLGERIGPDTGGLIALDLSGAPGAVCNTAAMGRAYLGRGMDAPAVAVMRDEPFPVGAPP